MKPASDRLAPADSRLGIPASWLMAGLAAVACLIYFCRQQFGPWRHQALQVDELYFSACASRALVDGLAAVAGCHDNKAPLIFLLHGSLHSLSQPFDFLSLKLASGLLLAAIATLAATIARRATQADPRLAAMATVTLLVVALVANPVLLALKTELLGVLFVLVALHFALREHLEMRHSLCAGMAMGLALMSKQSYLFLLPVGFWLVWRTRRNQPLKRSVARYCAHAIGILLPCLLLAALFATHGKLQEFLASTFLYPTVYGNVTPPPGGFKAFVWRSALVGEFLQFNPIHAALVLFALLDFNSRSMLLQRGLLLACILALVLLLSSPVLFNYHLIPFWVLASVLAGPVLADACSIGGRSRTFATTALLAAALFGLGATLQKNSATPNPDTLADLVQPAAGQYAYVLGMEPRFYAKGFIPASSVQFPWALPGTPGSLAYRPPGPGWLQEILTAQQQRNLVQLYADFARTPPAYILTTDLHARAPGSPGYTDVPRFDDYLARHCEHRGVVVESHGYPSHLFACRPPAD